MDIYTGAQDIARMTNCESQRIYALLARFKADQVKVGGHWLIYTSDVPRLVVEIKKYLAEIEAINARKVVA